MAEFHGVPAPYLAKALQALMRAEIVDSSPGRHGGYRLRRPAGEISLLDIVLAVEGDEPFFRCSEIRRRGPSRVAARLYTPTCGVAAAMWRAEEAWRQELGAITVADLLADVMVHSPPAAIRKGVTWMTSVVIGRR